jgi:hypothetical protein
MTDNVDLTFLARQLERVLRELLGVRGSNEIIRRDQGRANDDLHIIKSELMSIHRELDSIKHDMQVGFDNLDARVRPLEEIQEP